MDSRNHNLANCISIRLGRHITVHHIFLNCPTARVTRWWVGRDNATLTEPTSSHPKCLKTRRLPPVGCTLCWAFFVAQFNLSILISSYSEVHFALADIATFEYSLKILLPNANYRLLPQSGVLDEINQYYLDSILWQKML